MQIAVLYLSTAVIFFALDAIMLTMHMKPLFERFIGPLMLDSPRFVPAGIFYAAYIAGLLYLVSFPALKSGSSVLIPAAVLGAMAYGTYEFTSFAIMKDWNIQMVLTDVIWGTALTALSAWGGVMITRALVSA